ncbi:MAG: hypothetical protein ACE5LL_07375 [Alphaproteobacteria bacterium]
MATLRDDQLLAETSIVSGYVQQTRDDTAPWGFAGGGPGGKPAFLLSHATNREEVLPSKVVRRKLERGEALRLVGAGAAVSRAPVGGSFPPKRAVRDKAARRPSCTSGAPFRSRPAGFG